MNTEKIVERIRKLIRLANDAGASEGERDNAMRMAQATMAKYNLEMSSIKDASYDSQREDAPLQYKQFHAWSKYIGWATATLFFCNYYFSQHSKSHHFVGKKANVASAQEFFRYLYDSVQKEARKPKIPGGYERSFCNAAAQVIYSRAKTLSRAPAAEVASSSTAVVALYTSEFNENQAYLESQGKKTIQAKSHSRSTDQLGYSEGANYGSRIGLRNQVNSKNYAKLGTS